MKVIFILKNSLKEFLNDYDKVIILGIGNELKRDDGVGPFIISELQKLDFTDKVILINAQTVPENFTGKIRRENPSHIIIIDACLMGLNSGDIKIVDSEDFVNIGISTHSMSLSYFIKFLNVGNILFIGIEPQSLELIDEDILGFDVSDNFNGNLSKPVKKSAFELIEILKGIL